MLGVSVSNSWKRVLIKDLYLGLYDGPHATPKPSSSGPVFLGIKNITEDGRLDFSQIRNISEDDFPKWTKRVLPRAGDLVFSYEATLNLYALIPEGFRGCLGRRLALIRPDTKIIDPKFLYYCFFGKEWRNTIFKNLISGSTVDRISLINFPNFEISIPSLPVQRKIASILSSYDNLIENNTKRIEILEKMAKLIYEEWFVKFKFPGHENAKMLPSDLGEIPEGWEVKKLREILSHYIGGGWGNEQKQEKFTVGSYVIRGTDIPHLKNGVIDNVPYRFHKDSNFKSRKIEPFDIIIEVSGGSKDQPVGRAVLITEELLQNFIDNVMCASFCKLLRLNSLISPYYVDQILQLLYDTREINKYQTQSTGISNFKFEFFIDDLGILIPSSKVLNEFHNILDPIYKEICLLGSKNQNLRKTRDLLLPKLISGEIDVSDLDIHIRNELLES